jgi:Tfp pilus assembly protein PilO
MKNLPKDKRNRLIMVIAITILVLTGLYFGLISYQEKHLEELAESKAKLEGKLDTIQQVVKNADYVETEVASTSKRLSELEDDMVTGDAYAWMYPKMKEFKSAYKTVEVAQLVPTMEGKDVNVLPKFPYKYVSFTVQGTAFFHDFGKFLADLENHFPLFRVLNLDLQPAPAQAETDKEKLTFKMEILPLVKPGA